MALSALLVLCGASFRAGFLHLPRTKQQHPMRDLYRRLSGARCDLHGAATMSFPKRPADCDLDWGHAFEVGATGEAHPPALAIRSLIPRDLCSITAKASRRAAIACTSAKTGMTCINREGHGFTRPRGPKGLLSGFSLQQARARCAPNPTQEKKTWPSNARCRSSSPTPPAAT